MTIMRSIIRSIGLIDKKSQWDDFINKSAPHTFLQSWEWGEFNQSLSNKIWRVGIFKDKILVATSLILKIKAKRGCFLFVPHGPILKLKIESEKLAPSEIEGLKVLKVLRNFLTDLGRKEKVGFIRIAPIWERNKENEQMFKDLGFRKAPIHIHSERSWILDVTKPEDELLKEMRKTTRYLIKQGKRLGIEVEKSSNVNDLEKFYQLYKQTEKRQVFVAYDFDYLKKESSAFLKNKRSCLYFAYYNHQLLSAAFIVLSSRSAFYHHGASSLKYPKIPTSYALQWYIIQDLKKQGFRFYNFWGIAPDDKPNHPWYGLTTFKKGFGGFAEEYLPTQDYLLKPTYWFNWMVETVRKIARGY